MIRSILVAGGGSAGFLTALIIKQKHPDLDVTIVRSKEIGVIGVGESTTVAIPQTLHGTLDIPPSEFHARVMPSWKLGIRFLWGPRPCFDYTFEWQMDWKWQELPRPNGYYCEDDMTYVNVLSALMSHNMAFLRQDDGLPYVVAVFGYHIENRRFVAFLEDLAPQRGIRVIDDVVKAATVDDHGVTGVQLASGRSLAADLYVDCTGFRSLLLHQTLREPFVSFASTLFNDRARVGSWMRTDEPIQPYTTAETMNAGWCWRIDHPDIINRGYVYSSAFLSDDEAEREFRAKNPKVENTNLVKFVSGRYERVWVKNVVAIGNACAFVEPLESTALAMICDAARILADSLLLCNRQPTPMVRDHYNISMARAWDTIRDFLGIHFKFNTRLDTSYWRAARADAVLGPVQQLVDYYRELGPNTFHRFNLIHVNDMFGMEGYLSLLVGQRVPYKARHVPSDQERLLWQQLRERNRQAALRAVSCREALEVVARPECRWKPGFFKTVGESRMTNYSQALE